MVINDKTNRWEDWDAGDSNKGKGVVCRKTTFEGPVTTWTGPTAYV